MSVLMENERLAVGDYVHFKEDGRCDTLIVEEIYGDGIGATSVGGMFATGAYSYCDLAPIPITPEILTRLGFAQHHHDIYKKDSHLYFCKHGEVEIYHERQNGKYKCKELFDAEYVHELQILVFALTKQRLILDGDV